MKIMLQNIMQAYIQLNTELNCIVICHLPTKLKERYPKKIVIYIIKLLYSLVKVGNYQFAIYLNYYKEKLGMKMSFYYTCLLITKADSKNFQYSKTSD